jgi:signal transduction histidine kinase
MDKRNPSEIHTTGIRAIRQIAHKVIDQLTAVSGHSQLALDRARNTCVREELEKIRDAADKAVVMVRLSIVHLRELEEGRS